jgi:hypothetical protein
MKAAIRSRGSERVRDRMRQPLIPAAEEDLDCALEQPVEQAPGQLG